MAKANSQIWRVIATHAALLAYSAFALFPVLLIILNSFKDRLTIFSSPFALPDAETFTLAGYQTLSSTAHFDLFFLNRFLVTATPLALILAVRPMPSFPLP